MGSVLEVGKKEAKSKMKIGKNSRKGEIALEINMGGIT